MTASLPLLAYDAAWRLALGPLLCAARLDAFLRGRWGRGCLPPEWRVRDRLLLDPASPAGAEGAVWMHAASLGECQGLWAAYESLSGGVPGDSRGGDGGRDAEAAGPGEGARPVARFLLTAQTATGFAFLAKAAERAAGERPEVRMAPLDHPDLVRRFLDRHRVLALVLYEVELWPGMIRAASERGIPAMQVSARMTPGALARYRLLRGTWSPLLDRLDWIQARGPGDAERIRSLTRAPVASGADFKLARHRRAAAGAPAIRPDRRRLAFLSLHLRELRWFLPELPGLMERFPITVLPRRPEEMEAFRRILVPMGFALHGRDPGARHVLVDSLGRVGEVLPACGSAFVGGSLVPAGCHNLWEPLLAGLRIHFGPSTHNQEPLAGQLVERGIAERVTGRSQVRAWREADPGIAAACRAVAREHFRFLEASEAALRARLAASLSRVFI